MNSKEQALLAKSRNYYQQKMYAKAERTIAKIKSTDSEVYKLAMQVYFSLKQYAKCSQKAELYLRENPNLHGKKQAYLLLAKSQLELEQVSSARINLEKSMSLDSSIDNAEAIVALLMVYMTEYNLVGVETLAPRLKSWSKYFLISSLFLIRSAARMGKRELLKKRLMDIFPYAEAIEGNNAAEIVNFMMDLGLYDEATTLIFRHKKVNPKANPRSLLSKLYLFKKQYQEVIDWFDESKLEQYPATGYHCAVALDKQEDYARAFTYLTSAAKIRKKEQEKAKQPDYVKLYLSALNKLKPVQSQANPNGYQHVFAVGFPRSGTTLLDNVLDTQAEVMVLSEPPTIQFVVDAFASKLKKNYPRDLASLTEEEIEVLREVYFNTLRMIDQAAPQNGVLVDKNPHHTVHLPLIKTLFPHAKIILSLRHPLDVCLSCFQIDFSANEHNRYLVTLDEIVNRYQEVFSLVEGYQTNLNIDYLELRYEDLLSDFDAEMLRVFNYIGLEGDDSYKEFHKHAGGKYVVSASRGQTDQPLYNSSKEKWRNYQEQLGVYIPALAHFIDKYGYSTE
ncbi:tetratricopeptide repeat-containing sulfotransferase family protein [Thalassomonas actiniarum]|uniref:Sulfotransferase n=1 Tax=Thalassomonas actiniarum TaxID=485447 RepID=A0AAE9YU91_9GAMM|nr:sulfotransferase [Thalassomonas actiniarum]WDE00529.1 sulfotransferase [Thalassomonas actiniarum]